MAIINSPGGAPITPPLTVQDLLDLDFLRVDENGFIIDGTGTNISGSPAVADQDALLALDASLYDGFVLNVQSGMNNSFHASNGTAFGPLNGQYVQEKTNLTVAKLVVPANALTWTAANNGGTVRLTTVSNASHGLTTSPAVGCSLRVISGTGWTANSDHVITAVDDTSGVRTVDLATAWASQGAPTVADTTDEIVFKTVTLPKLRGTSIVLFEFSTLFTVFGSTHSIRTRMYLDGTNLYDNNFASTSNAYTPFRWGIKNLGATNSQRGLSASNSTGYQVSTGSPLTAAVDTSVSKDVTFAFLCDTPNLACEMTDLATIIRG